MFFNKIVVFVISKTFYEPCFFLKMISGVNFDKLSIDEDKIYDFALFSPLVYIIRSSRTVTFDSYLTNLSAHRGLAVSRRYDKEES